MTKNHQKNNWWTIKTRLKLCWGQICTSVWMPWNSNLDWTLNSRALNNKWLRWKYADELKQAEEKWMQSNKCADMGWAVGRRIYEKEEIEVFDLIWFFFKYFKSINKTDHDMAGHISNSWTNQERVRILNQSEIATIN